MSYITQTCSDLVHAQAKIHRLALIGPSIRRDQPNAGPGMRISLEFAQATQLNELQRVGAILASLPAANDMDMHVGAA